MECTGRFAGASIDWKSRKLTITIEVNEDYAINQIYKELQDEPLDIKIVKHRRKRSNDANRYFHELVGILADALGYSRAHTKNTLIASYGQQAYTEEGDPLVISVASKHDRSMEELNDEHYAPVGHGYVNGCEFTHWVKMRGSHTYNTKEMARLIDGACQECIAQGIDPRTPDEIARDLGLRRSYEV